MEIMGVEGEMLYLHAWMIHIRKCFFVRFPDLGRVLVLTSGTWCDLTLAPLLAALNGNFIKPHPSPEAS